MPGVSRVSATYVGVDVSERRGLDVVVLDAGRRLCEPPLRRLEADDLARLLADRQPRSVAIDSPPAFGTSGSSRAPERELAALGIPCFRTPSDPQRCRNPFYNWMRAGHAAFAAAARAGYRLFPGGPSTAGWALEVFPHASAVALGGRRPPAGTSRRAGAKRRWREVALRASGVPTAGLASLDAVDAALAALTALLADEGSWFAVGSAADGFIVLPGARPPGPYPATAGPGVANRSGSTKPPGSASQGRR